MAKLNEMQALDYGGDTLPKDEVAQLKKDIAGYQLFTKLAEQYADEVIQVIRVFKQVPYLDSSIQ